MSNCIVVKIRDQNGFPVSIRKGNDGSYFISPDASYLTTINNPMFEFESKEDIQKFHEELGKFISEC